MQCLISDNTQNAKIPRGMRFYSTPQCLGQNEVTLDS